MQIYYDLQNQSKLISVQSPPIGQALQLKGQAASGVQNQSSINQFNQKSQKQQQIKNPPHFKINTNLQLHDTLGQNSPFALGIRPGVSPSAHLVVGNFQMNQTNQIQRQTQQASSILKTEHGNDNVTGMSYIMSPTYQKRSKNSSEEKPEIVHNDRLSRNMENLTSMKLVGGSSRLNQLIQLMSKQDQKKQRLKTLEQMRMNHKQDDSQHYNSTAQITGQPAENGRNDVHYFNFNEEENQDLNLIEKLNQKQTLRKKQLNKFKSNSKQKTTIHVVISVSNSNESLKGIKEIDGVDSQLPSRNSKRVGNNVERNVGHLLSKIQSVQRLDQKIDNSSQIDLEINSYTNQPINITQPSSTMIHSSGNKQIFDDYAKQYNLQKLMPSNLIQFPHTAKNLKAKHMSVQFNQKDIKFHNGQIQPINLLSKQGIGYSASKKSLIKLPAINQKQESQNLMSPTQFISNKKYLITSPQSQVNIKNDAYKFVTPGNQNESVSSDQKYRSKDYTKASQSKSYSYKKNILGSKKSIAQIQNENLARIQKDQQIDDFKSDKVIIDKGNSLRLNQLVFPKDKSTNKISLNHGISPQTRVLTQVLTQKPSQVILQNEKYLQSIKNIRNVFGPSENNLSNINSNQSLLFQPSQSQLNGLSNQISHQTLSQYNNDPNQQPVNYSLLQDDTDRSKQLMKLFNQKLKSIGVQKQIIDQIIQKGAGSTVENQQSRFEPKKGSLGKAGIQGELMNLQMVVAQQEIENKPGGHILGIAPIIEQNNDSIKQIKEIIVKQHQEAIDSLVYERQQKRDVLINTSKHLKALNLIEQVENNIRKKKGSMNVDLSIDQNKVKYGKVRKEQSELSKLSEYLQNEQKKKKIRFIDKFDFTQFNDAEYDSDFAEQITLNAIHIDESNMQNQEQNQKYSPKKAQNLIPLLQKSPQVSSFKGTKFDKLINSPIDEKLVKGDNDKKYRTNQDGSIIYSQEQINMIKDKSEIADKRVNQKLQFDNQMKQIQNNPNLLEDVNLFQPHEWSVDLSKEYPGTLKLTVPVTQTLNRKQSNLIFKEDFEMKIVSMNNQIQMDFDEANKSLNFSRNLVGPHPTYIDIIDDTNKKEANRVKMLLAKYKKNGQKVELKEEINPFQSKNQLLLKHSTLDLNESIFNTVDQSLENSLESPQINTKDQKLKPIKMMSNWKKKKEELIRKEEEKQKKLRLLNEDGRKVSPLSDYKGYDESKIETFSEKKQRENLQEYHQIRVLPIEERKQRIMEKSLQMNDIDYADEQRKKKIFDFVNRINRDEEFPLNVIDKLIVLTIQKINNLNKKSDISQLINQDQDKDEIINGLCLLKALKNEAVQELIMQQSTLDLQLTTKYLTQAAQMVKEFKLVQKNNEEEIKIDSTMLLSRYLTQQLGRAVSNLTQETEDQNRQSPLLDNNQFYIHNSKLFQGVLKSLFNKEQSQQIIKKLSETSVSSINQKKQTKNSNNIEIQNQILQSLQQQQDEIINKILESDTSQVAMLKQELAEVKKEIDDLQLKIKAKMEENILNQVKIDTKDYSVQQFARKINLQNEFFSICKFAERAKIENDLNNNPVLNYYQNCRQAGALSLPLLNKIQNKAMVVVNYKLNEGVCSGIADAFIGNQKLVQTLIFDTNGLIDKDFSKILQGAQHLDQIKVIIYRTNEFQFQSLHSLMPILSRRKPQNLEELRIVNCKITSAVSGELIDALINNSSGLKKLSLVNANITQQSFINLLNFIEECRSIIDLDLSFNGFLSTQMFELIKVLSKNRKLESVNLSWNTLQEQETSLAPFQLEGFPGQKITKKQKKAIERTIGQFSLVTQQALLPENFEDQNKMLNDVLIVNQQLQNEEIEEKKSVNINNENQNDQDKEQQQNELQKEEIKQSPLSLQDPNQPEQPTKKKFEKEPPPPGKSEADLIWKKRQQFLEKFNKDLGKNITSFIKYNQNLFHLDLTSTGLNEELMKKIGISLNKSRALCCIHLSNNPGITERNIQFIQQRIKCKNKLLGLQLGTTIIRNISIDFKYPPIDINNNDSEIKSDLIHENLKLQQIKRNMQIYSNQQNQITNNIENKLEIQRYLGHQFDIPGSQQWCILNNPYDPLEKCWIYDQWIHTLIFWSPTIGSYLQELKSIQHIKYKEKIVEQIIKEFPTVSPLEQMNSEDKLTKRTAKVFDLCKEDDLRPMISCEFTNWKPKRMLRIEEYCLQLESLTTKKGIDFFDILRQQGKINQESNHKDFNLLDENEQKEYLNLKKVTIDKYQKAWPQTVADEIRFKKPFLCNGEHLGKILQDENIYVFPCYLKPGKQNYVIIQDQNLASNQENEIDLPLDLNKYYIHKCIAENRREEIPIFGKPFKMGKKQRKFKHDQSIFKNWKPDNAQTFDSCIQHDFQFCKFSRFVKPIPEIVKVMDILKKHFEAIKQIYHYLMSKSSYPGILFQDYNNWIIGLKLIDNNLDLPAVDRDFIAALYVEDKIDGAVNPLNALSRYQFLEILVRVAKTKFEIKGQTFIHSVALERLISECILKNDKSEPWQLFRKKELWKLPVCDLLEPNLPGLKQVYESHFVLRKTNMDLQDCQELFYHKTGLLKQEKYVTYCFGMSKMTIVDEVKGGKKYQTISFIEFVELIGRVAHFRYKDDPDYANVDLASKIEFVLDEVLGTLNIKRLDPIVIVLDESESDEDY